MMKKFNKALDTPITWKASLIMSGICMLAYAISYLILYLLTWTDVFDGLEKKFRRNDKNDR